MPARADARLAVIIPAYEAAATVAEVVTAARAADLVLGARARAGAMPLSRRLTNWLSATLASRIGGVAVVDAQTGFRAISRRLADAVRPSQTGYDFETAFLLAALAGGYRV